MKICRICRLQKPVDEFYKDSHYADGRKADCKPCYTNRNMARMRSKPQQTREQKRAWEARNPDKVSAWRKRWRSANISKARALYAEWAARNRDKVNANDRKRMARKMNALPKWANLEKIAAIYAKAKAMGRGYHVDHIVPLQGKTVCGLHVEYNLQILPAYENQSKGNRLPDDERMFA